MKYDILVLGSGPGGYVTAIRASQLGMKVAVVEREALGGICLNWGCIPTKALLKSANVFEYIEHAEDYGIKVSKPKVDFGGMVSRSRGVADGMSKGVQFLMKKNKIDVIMGDGKLLAGRKVEVTDTDGSKQVVEADHIIIATGARSRQLPNLPQDGKKIIGYREAMTMAKQPKKMVVVGSGAIGVEFAYFYNAIGTDVTIVEYMPNIVPVEDEEVSKQLARSFKKTGINIMTSSEVTGVDTSGSGCKVNVKTKKGEETLEADVVLSAVGVVSNIDGIGLEEVGIAADRGKVIVDDFYKTNIPGYHALGDCVPGACPGPRCQRRGHPVRREDRRPRCRAARLRQHSRMHVLLPRGGQRRQDRGSLQEGRHRHQGGQVPVQCLRQGQRSRTQGRLRKAHLRCQVRRTPRRAHDWSQCHRNDRRNRRHPQAGNHRSRNHQDGPPPPHAERGGDGSCCRSV